LFDRKKHAKILEKLIELGADCRTEGWMKVNNELIFGSPLELAFHLKKENDSPSWTDSIKNIAKVLLTQKEKSYCELTQAGNNASSHNCKFVGSFCLRI
jgi:hypothetical protein